MRESQVVILGGGPAGVGGAWYLRRCGRAQVTLFEQQETTGGNAGSFEIDGLRVDYGSHRLHHACDPAILADIRALLGNDLLRRPRHGRIRLRGRWVHFPLQPIDLLLRLDRRFALSAARDLGLRLLPGRAAEGDSFASVLRANLGSTICDHFYFPYARKIWGREPEELSAIQAKRRVSAGSFRKLLEKVLKPRSTSRFFYYPRNGYGQISTAFAEGARELGADIRLGWRVNGIEARHDGRWAVRAERNGAIETVCADHVWSTIPLPLAARLMQPAVPAEVMAAASNISYRAMVLVYLVLDVDRFTATDAHYFPEQNVTATRISEPKNYSAATEPRDRTVLCAEVPCSVDDELWRASDDELGRRIAADLEMAGIPLPRAPVRVVTRRLKQAYPIYLRGYEVPFGVLDRWAESIPAFLVYGRQGLFAHDNTHHALYMASAAADCLIDGRFDQERWRAYREVFATHVVED
jgi:protoporphyrinogen oxidase